MKKVLFCLTENTNLMLEEGEEMLVADAGQTSDDATPLLSRAATQGCHFALCNATHETKESKKGAWKPWVCNPKEQSDLCQLQRRCQG